jgi:hypothetical protein
MTDLQGQPQQSAFNQRSDTAALALKGQLSQQLSAMTGQRVDLPPTPVQVNEHGQPVGSEQIPPEGSYARQAWEQQRAARAQQEALAQHQRATYPQGQPQGPEAAQLDQPQEQHEQVSQRTQERISSLVSQLRQKDQDYATLQQQLQQRDATASELQAQYQASQNQLHSIMQEHLEHLDPDTRAQVLADARIKQAVALSEQRILHAVAPRLDALQVRNDQLEKVSLSGHYQGYDPGVHDHLIDEFRRQNPNCSIEQAFRAVATPEELRVGGARPANPPPPMVPPGNGAATPRYLPQQNSQPDPVEQMRMDAAEAARLARSLDPADQKRAQALFDKNLRDRLSGVLPGQR